MRPHTWAQRHRSLCGALLPSISPGVGFLSARPPPQLASLSGAVARPGSGAGQLDGKVSRRPVHVDVQPGVDGVRKKATHRSKEPYFNQYRPEGPRGCKSPVSN